MSVTLPAVDPTVPLAIDARGIRRVYKTKQQVVVALDGIDLDGRAGRVLRPARAERRGQDHAHQDPDDAAPAERGARPGSSASTSRPRRSSIRRIMNMVAGGEQSGYGMLTVREQLWMFSQFYGLGVREGWRRVDELIEAVGLQEQRLQRVGTLSTGQRQKMNFARGLLNDPWIFFLDEPTLGLDVVGRPRGPRARPRLAGRRPGPDRPAHDPLHGRGRRAVRADRDRRPRPDPRDRHARASSSGASRASRSSASSSTGWMAAPPCLARLPGVVSAVAGPRPRRSGGEPPDRGDQPGPDGRRRRSAASSGRWPAWARTSWPCASPSRAWRTSSSSSSAAASTMPTAAPPTDGPPDRPACRTATPTRAPRPRRATRASPNPSEVAS